MKINPISYLLICPCMLGLLSCMQNTAIKDENSLSQDSIMDAPPAEDRQYCFLHTEGTNHQDSSFVQLTLKGDSIAGTYNWLPFEKDSRQGTLKGKKSGDTLDAVWNYIQEGIQDSVRTRFILKNDVLIQQPFTVNEEDGRQVLDKEAPFAIEYDKIDCPE